MLMQGVLHVHSTLSHDGRMSLDEIARWFRAKNCQFVCMAEHSEDMNAEKVDFLRRRCADLSSREFCIIPGIEYGCGGALHIAGIGSDQLLETSDPVQVARTIRDAGNYAVLAHPRRIGWQCEKELISAVHAMEIWNVRYDGKFLPCPRTIQYFRQSREVNEKLHAACGLDLHAQGGYYGVFTELESTRCAPTEILAVLRAGDYRIVSPLWRTPATGEVPRRARVQARVLRPALRVARAMWHRISH